MRNILFWEIYGKRSVDTNTGEFSYADAEMFVGAQLAVLGVSSFG